MNQIAALVAAEWRLYRVQPWLWLATATAMAFAVVLLHNHGLDQAQPFKRLLLHNSMVLMLVQPLVIGVLAPFAFLRDPHYRMDGLIDVLPLTPQQWLLSRAGALFGVTLSLQLLLDLVLWYGVSLDTPSHAGPLALFAIWCFLLQQIPALLLLVSLHYWFSRYTDRVTVLYIGSAVLWLGYMMLATASGSPLMAQAHVAPAWLQQLMLWADPYGLAPWLAQAQQGADLTPGAGVWCNRALVVMLALLLCYRALQRHMNSLHAHRPHNPSSYNPPPAAAVRRWWGRRRTRQGAQCAELVGANAIRYQPLASSSSRRWPRLIALIQLQCGQLWRQRSHTLALLALLTLVFSEVSSGLQYVEPFSQQIPTSLDALNRVMGDVLPVGALLFLALSAYLLSWQSYHVGSAGIIAATPVSNGVLLSSQLLCLWISSAVLVLVALLLVGVAQAIQQVPLSVHWYGRYALVQWLVLASWAPLLLGCHAVARSPWLGNVGVAVLLLLGLSVLPQWLGLHHPLWHIGQSQLDVADSLWGWQGALGAPSDAPSSALGDLGSLLHGGFWPYWLLWSLLGACVLSFSWRVNTRYHRGVGASSRSWPQRLTMWRKPWAALRHHGAWHLFLLLCLGQAWHIDQQWRQANALQSPSERQAKRALYEQRYLHWQQQPQPDIQHVQLQVQLDPAAQRADIRVMLTLHNPHPQPISQLLLGFVGFTALAAVTPSVAAEQTLDPDLGQTVLQLRQPLQQHEQLTLSLQLTLEQQAIVPSPAHQVLRGEFSYLRLMSLLPQLGFVPELTLDDANQRQRFGLAALTDAQRLPSEFAATQTPASARYDWATLDITLAVPAGYQAIAAGKRIKQWQQGAMTMVQYQTSAPVRNLPALVVVPWPSQQDRVGDIALEIYSPDFNAATDQVMQAMRDTLAWFEKHIGAFPGDAIRVVMTPDIGPSGYALPQLVLLDHQRTVRATPSPEAPFSQVYRRTAHEVAHQWFGHGIGNGVTADSAFLVESITKYVELVLIERHQGRAAMQGLVEFERQRFVQAQAGSTATAHRLVDAQEAYDQYSRATLVFALLRQQLGDDVLIRTLRALWQQHRYPAAPASSMDFVRQLKAFSPRQHHALIDQLLLSSDVQLLLDARH